MLPVSNAVWGGACMGNWYAGGVTWEGRRGGGEREGGGCCIEEWHGQERQHDSYPLTLPFFPLQ